MADGRGNLDRQREQGGERVADDAGAQDREPDRRPEQEGDEAPDRSAGRDRPPSNRNRGNSPWLGGG